MDDSILCLDVNNNASQFTYLTGSHNHHIVKVPHHGAITSRHPFRSAVSAGVMHALDYLEAILSTVIFFVGIVANMLIVIITVRAKRMHTVTNVLIANLAVSDLVAELEIPFVATAGFLRTWIFGEILCKLIVGLQYLVFYVSLGTMAFISFDRYLAVCLKSNNYKTTRFGLTVVGVSWCVSGIISIPLFMLMENVECLYTGQLLCTIRRPYTNIQFLAYCLTIGGIFVAVPGTVMCIMYTKVVIKLRNTPQFSDSTRNRSLRIQIRLMQMLIFYGVSFFGTWSPVLTIHIATATGYIPFEFAAGYTMSIVLMLGNTALNPCMCFAFNENYKREFRALFKIQEKKDRGSSDNQPDNTVNKTAPAASAIGKSTAAPSSPPTESVHIPAAESPKIRPSTSK